MAMFKHLGVAVAGSRWEALVAVNPQKAWVENCRQESLGAEYRH